MFEQPMDDQEYLHFKGQEMIEKLEAEIDRLETENMELNETLDIYLNETLPATLNTTSALCKEIDKLKKDLKLYVDAAMEENVYPCEKCRQFQTYGSPCPYTDEQIEQIRIERDE